MKRRTVLKRMGIASTATVALSGSAAARPASAGNVLGDVDVTVDVSDVAGEVVLADVLTDEQVADIDVDPSRVRLTVGAEVDEVTPSHNHCCDTRCCEEDLDCPSWCGCCTCINCLE